MAHGHYHRERYHGFQGRLDDDGYKNEEFDREGILDEIEEKQAVQGRNRYTRQAIEAYLEKKRREAWDRDPFEE